MEDHFRFTLGYSYRYVYTNKQVKINDAMDPSKD